MYLIERCSWADKKQVIFFFFYVLSIGLAEDALTNKAPLYFSPGKVFIY